MAQIAKTFWWAGSQAVRLPREFWFEGDELRIERLGALIVLSPIRGPSVMPHDRSPASEPCEPRFPPPGVTFAGFHGPRPTPARSPAETLAEVKRLFGQLAANDNEPLHATEKPAT
jgi:virulence-associated protein VagC